MESIDLWHNVLALTNSTNSMGLLSHPQSDMSEQDHLKYEWPAVAGSAFAAVCLARYAWRNLIGASLKSLQGSQCRGLSKPSIVHGRAIALVAVLGVRAMPEEKLLR